MSAEEKKSPFVRSLNRTVVLPCLLMWCYQRVLLWANSPRISLLMQFAPCTRGPAQVRCAWPHKPPSFLLTAQGISPETPLQCLLNCTVKLPVTLKQIRSRQLQSPLWPWFPAWWNHELPPLVICAVPAKPPCPSVSMHCMSLFIILYIHYISLSKNLLWFHF